MAPKINFMSTPSTRADFEERMHVLRENLRLGTLRYAEGLHGPDSLMKVRSLPNGRIDLLSIDESARLQANMMHQMLIGAFGTLGDEFDSDMTTGDLSGGPS